MYHIMVLYAMGHSMSSPHVCSMDDNNMSDSVCGLPFKTLYSTYYKQLTHLLPLSFTHLPGSVSLSYTETDTHTYRNLQRPICSITGWCVIIIITAAQSSQGSVCLVSRHTLGSSGIIVRSECFLDWINGNGHWGQTCQGVGFVTGSHWVLNPCLCAVLPMWAPSYCVFVCRVYFFKEQI